MRLMRVEPAPGLPKSSGSSPRSVHGRGGGSKLRRLTEEGATDPRRSSHGGGAGGDPARCFFRKQDQTIRERLAYVEQQLRAVQGSAPRDPSFPGIDDRLLRQPSWAAPPTDATCPRGGSRPGSGRAASSRPLAHAAGYQAQGRAQTREPGHAFLEDITISAERLAGSRARGSRCGGGVCAGPPQCSEGGAQATPRMLTRTGAPTPARRAGNGAYPRRHPRRSASRSTDHLSRPR